MTRLEESTEQDLIPLKMESLPLSNGLVLEAWDMSKHTAGDRSQVVLACRMVVALSPDLFPPDKEGRKAYEELRNEFGPALTWEFKDERNFVARNERKRVWRKMFEQFKNDSLSYLSHRHFADRFSLSVLGKLRKDPLRLKAERSKSVFNRLPPEGGLAAL